MNKIFKVIWSKSKQCYIVVSEIAKNKTGKKKIVVAGIFAALSLIGHLQPVQAIDGAGDKAGFSNAASGVNFDSTKGIAIGLKNGDKTSANGNVATVAIGAHSNASGSSSVAIGGAVVDGAGAIGLGWSTAKGNNAVALGGTGLTNANGNNAFAASGGNANGESATAIGSSAIASGRGGVAVGWNSQSAVNAVGIGFNAKAKSNNTVAIGVEANSDNSIGDNSSSVSIGVKTRAREVGSMAMGVSADASGKYSIALGSGNVSGDYTATANYPKATGEKAIAIGYNSNSSNTGATAIGAGATASGTDSFAGGSGTAGGNSSIAIGKGASITAPIAGTTFGGQDSIAMGTGASAKQHSSVTIGVDSTSDGVRNITIGPKASASGVDSIAIGNGGVGGDKNNTGVGGNGNTYTIDVNGISTNVYYGVKSVDNGSIAFGNRANAAKGGLAIGTVSIADGGIAVGQSVLSKNGVAIGSAVSATAANAVALGSRAEASSVGAVAIGGYSVTDKTKAQGNNALAIGASAVTNGNETIAIGKSANASNSNAVAVGKNANASIANSVAIGSDSTTDTNATRQANTTINGITYNFAGATSDTGMQVSVGAAGKERQIKNVAAGEVSATSTDAINGSQLFAVASQIKPQLKYVSIKSDTELDNANNDGATADKAIAIGPIAKASSKSSVAIGNTSIASSENAIAIGNNSNSSGVDSVAIGPSSVSNNVGSVAVGKDAQANGAFTVALGGGNWQNKGAQANGVGTIALGTYTRTKESTNYQTAVGFESKTDAESATAIGYQAVASGKDSVALGTGASTTGQDALTFGHNSQANGNSSLAMGLGAQANSNNAIALGYQTNSNSTNSTNGVFIGSVAGKETNGVGNIGIGSNTGNKIIGDNNVSIGTGAGSVTATNVYASESIMLGTQARAINSTSTSPINNVIAIGKGSSGGANSTIAIGQNASSTNQNSIAIGTNASAPAYNGVAIGSFSVANTEGGTVEGYNANASRTDKYAGLTGAVLKGNIGAVSIGSGGTMTRQIKNLAAGTADTDAVNVAQLKSVNLAFKGNTGAGGDVNLAANPLTIKGNDSYITTNASGNTITISANQKDIHVISGTANADTGVANAKNVATAINDAISQNKYKWYLTADNDTAGSRSTIDKEGTVKFSGDPNITVARSGNTITSSLNKIITVDTVKASKSVIAGSGNDQITLDGTSGTVTGRNFSGQSFAAGNNVLSNTTLQIGSATNGDNNVTISRDGFSSKAGTKTAKFGATGIDAGGQVITNVSSGGNVGTNAANITDVKNYVGKVALNIQSNSKTGTINLEQGALGVTGANGIRTDLGGTGNSNLVIGLDKNTVNATTNGIGLSSDSGTMLRKFLKDGNADFKISGDGALVSTSGTTTGVQVSIDKSKVKDLAVEAVTVSKANTVDNPITVTSTAGTNSKEYAIGIDTSKLAAKTEVTYRANNAADANAKKVSLSKGLNFVDGDSTVATVDNDGKVSFDLNTATKNQINTNTTDIAANKGKIATNTTNIAANTTAIARNISLGADTGTASRQSLSTADVAFNVKGSTGDFVSTNMNGNTVEISTTRATINSDANTGAASVTGNDGLATAKNVADAINKAADAAKAGSAWNVSTNGDTSTKVSGGDTVDFTGDNNITVDRNNKTISTSLNKNLTDMNSISLGNPRGETIFLNGRDGSIKAGKAEFKDNVGAGSTITSDQLSFTNGATGANEATTTIALDTVSIQSGPNNSALTSKYLMFSDEDGNNAEGSAKGMGFQNAAGKTVQFSLDEIKAGGNKIQEVAEGTADTDAVNVKQLKDTVASQTLTYRANTAADADAKSVKLSKGLDFVDGTSTVATVDNDGKVSFDLNTATKTKIDDSATAVARKISLGADSGTVSSQSLKDGDVAFNVKGATGDFVSTKMNGNTVEISTTRATINSDTNTGVASVTGNDGLATAKNVADAINKAADAAKAGAAWNLTTNSSTTDKTSVQGGDTVDLINGDNIVITQDGTDKKKITVATKKDLTVDSVTAGNTVINTSGLTNGTTAITGSGITTDKVTVGGISLDKTDGINAGGKAISNVASGGTTDTNAANIGDVKQAVANLSQNLNITDGTNNGTVDLKNQKLNVAGANGVTATVNNQTITVGLDTDTVNATTKGIGLTADTGATGNKYLKDGDVSFAVTGDGNLVSTSATTAGVKVAVDAAKVKDLAIDAVTVSKDAQADNPITVTPTVGTNSKDYAIGIDTTKLAAKTDLTYRANNDTDANAKKVSLAKGLNFVNGTLTTASIDTDGVVKYDVNTASITAGTDGTITGPTTDGVATAKNVADAINAVKKASKTEITANTGEVANATTGNVTLTSTTAADGHTIYDVKLNDKVTLGSGANAVTIDGTTGTITGKTANIGGVTVNGTANTIGGLSNTTWNGTATTGRAATEDQLKAVADAASSQTWNITADKAGTTGAQTGTKKNATVGKDETVELVAGDNLTINQNERKFTYSLNKDIANLTSVSVGTGTTETIKLDGATGKITAKNASIGGVTIDGDNNHVTGLANTTWNGTATTGRAATEDQLKAVADTAKTTTDAVNLKFSGDTNTSPGVVNLKDDTLGIIGDGKYVSTDANGKNLTVKVSEAEVKKSAVAAVTVSTDTTDANNPLTVTPTTSADGTTKDYKVTIDGTKIANKTNLSYKANDGTAKQVSLADGLNFKNGTLTTASIDDNGVVKYDVNTASITAGADGTITGPTTDGVATAKNVADAINAAKKASKTEITANTGEAASATTGNVTLTSTTAADGHTIYDIKLNDKVTLGSGTNAVTIDGTTGAITGKTATIGGVTVNGTANTIGGLSNTTWNGTATTGRAATEDQLKAVADAAGSQTWKITADKKTGTSGAQTGTKENAKVGKDDKVSLIAGENLTVDQAGKNFTYSLNTDLVKMNSATFLGTGANTTVITGDSITQTAGTQTNTSTADGNTVADGTKSTKTTADGQVIKDGAKSNKSTVDNNVIDDGNGNVNTSNATSNTITDGTNTTATTSSSVTVKDNAGNSTVITKDNVTTGVGANKITLDGTAGKATIGSSIVDGVNNTFTTGGANAVTMNGAAGTVKTGTVTVTGGTTNDITGLSNTTVNSADFATKGRAATEEQLKAATGATTLKFTGDVATNTGSVNLKDDIFGIKGDGKYISTDVNGKNVNLTVSEAEVKKSAVAAVTVSTDTIDANNPLTVTPTTSADGTTKDYKVTIDGTKIANKTNLSYKANDGTAKQVSLADGLNFKNGTLTTASIDDNGVVKYDVNTASITAGADGTITGPTTDGVATAKNVADAINAAKKASKTEITANTGEAANATTGNVSLTSTTAADGHTIYDVKLNDKVTLGTGANAVTIDGTAGKATIGSSIVDGVNNTFTTGGASPVTLNGATGTITGKTANIGGVTVDGTNNHVMGLANKDWTPGVTQAVSGRAATEDQLQKVSDAVGAGWKVNTGKITGSTGESNGAASTKVASGEEVQFQAGNNLIVDQNGKTVAYSLNKALKDLESATFNGTGTNKTVITGDSITQTAGTQTNTSTAGGNTIADGTKSTKTTADGQVIKDGTKTNTSTVDENTIIDGTKSNKSTVDGNTITDGTNTTATTSSSVTVKDNAGNSTIITKDNITTGVGGNKITLDGTAGKATIGSSIVDGVNNTFTTGGTNAVALDGGAGTVKTGTVTVTGGTTNDITGLSNTTVTATDFATKGRAATEEQLKAVGEQTWQITADKDATTSGAQTGTKKDAKVGKDDKVQLIAGENMTVNQNERDFTFTLNKDLVKMNSATFLGTGTNTTVITGDSITQTAGTQTNTSTAAGNTVANGANSTATTAAGTTVTTANGNTNYAADGVRINTTGKTPVSLTDAGLDNGNNVIKNVASGHVNNDATDNTNAANIADVKKATTTVTANAGEVANATTGNVTLTSTAAADGHTIYDVKLNDKVTLGTGANAVMIDGTAGKATVGTAVVDGVNNIITTGGASPVTLNGATGTIIGKTANIGGVTVDGTNNHVMGLANKDWTPGVTQAVSGRAATEDQLQKVSDAVGAGWKVNTGKVTGSTGESNGAASTKVASGEEVQFQAGNNLIVDQNGKTVAYSLNKALKDLESATFNGAGTNKTVITGDSITQTAGTQTNTSTAAGNTVADGTKSTKTTADGQVIKDGTKTNTSTVDENTIVDGAKSNKTTVDSNVINDGNGNVNTSNATSNTITDGTNTVATTSSSVTVKDNAGNSTVITKDNITTGVGANKIILDGAAGTIKTGTVTVTGGTTNDITGLSNTTVTATDFATKGRAATEEQLKAVGEQTWQITADKKTGTSGAQTGLKENAKVGKDDKVSLIAGENLTVDQAGKNFTYSLNSDLVKMNSATFLGTGTNTTVITGDSITQTAGSQTNTSTAGGNTVADGTKSTEITAAGQVIKDGAKSNKSTVDKNVIDDGTGNVNTSNATSNTITDGTNTSTIAAGKATIGSSIIDGVNNTFTTGGASPVTLDGATGTITGKTANIGGVTVDGTNNHVMGLANKDWTPGVTQAVSGRAATEDQLQKVSDAVGAGWKVNTGKVTGSTGESNGAASTKVASGEEVQFQAGNNLIVDQNGKTVAYSLNKALKDLKSATFNGTGTNKTVITGDAITQTAGTQTNTSTAGGNTVVDGTKSTATTADGTTVTSANGNTKYAADGVRINTTGKNPVSLTDAGLDNGNNVIKNVASGHVNNDATDNTNAANIADVKKATTTVTANAGEAANATTGNVTLTSTTAADGHTIYDVKLNDKVTLGSGANAVTIDGTAGKATFGSSVVDGVNNTFTTGGANAVKLDGAAGTIKTGTVTVTGGTTNDITGLSNTTVTAADFATKGRAATEEQLKAVGEQTWQITADKDATTSGAQTGTKKDAKVGKDDKVQLIAGENMTVNQNERDFTFTLNKDLVKMNSATFEATGGKTTVIKGDSIVQTDGNKTNTATASGNTVANGTKSTETTADGQVIKDGTKSNKSTVDNNVIDDGNGNVNTSNATSNTITDGTNTTETTSSSVTVKDNAGNSTVITKDNITTGVGGNKITLDGTAGKATIGSSIVDGVNNTFTTGGANAVKLDGVAGTIKTGTVTVTGGTTNDITGLSNTTVNSADFATKGRAATEEQLKAVGEQTWQITADKDATTSGAQTGTKKDAKVGKDNKVQLIAGENMTINQNERDFTFTLNKDLVKMNSATFLGTDTNKTVITGDSITQTAGTQTNTSTAGGNTVADGTKSTKTTADGQVIKDGTKTNTSTVDENTIVDGIKSNKSTVDGNTITDGTNTTETTSSSVTVKDNAGNSTVITKDNITTGVGGNKITLDGTAGKATIGSSIIDGVNKTFTTGGANAVTMDGVAGTIKTGTVTVTGGTTNDITGLSNTTVNSADFATKGRAATEEQLKAVGEQTWQITADKDATTSGAQTGTKKDAKVGKDNKVQLIAGENMTINQNERDFTFTLNKDLVKMNSATFLGTGSNTTVITGNSITQTAGTQTNTSTAAGNTVADGTKSTETTAAGQVIKDGAKTNKSTVDTNVIDDGNGNKNTSNATSNTITDGTNTSTITAGKANIGNIAVDGVNNKITMGNGGTPVTLDGANGHLDGLTNTTWVPGVTKATTGRAATEDQLQQVSDAVGAGWKVNTGTVAGSSGVSNGATSTKVSSGEEVKLQAGDNLVIDQNGKTVSYSLNKDLTKMNSATFEATGGKTTVIKGDSIVQTDGSKTNTSNAAGNTVVDGNKSTATTAAGTTITDGAKTNTSTADKNVINDGAGNTNTATATSNTLKNAAGDETKADAKGVTVKDAAGNNATFTKDGITITNTSKDTVSLTSNGLDNGKNKIINVADGTNPTDAVNVRQLDAKTKAATTELTANDGQHANSTNGNIMIAKSIDTKDGHTIYDTKLNDKITLGAADPTKAITVDGIAGTIKAGKDGNAVAINGTNGTVKAGDGTNAVAIDGVNGTIAVADKITLNGKDGKAGIGTVGIDGKDGIITTGGTNSVKVDGATGTVTGLTNKTWTPGSIVSGRAATEDQLKDAVADSGWKVAVGKDGSGKSNVVGTSPEKIKAEETVTFKAGNNMMVTQTGKSISYAVNPELTNMTSATFTDSTGNTTVMNSNGITITPSGANPTNPYAGPVSLTKEGLNNGNNQIKGVAPGTDPTDAVNVAQLNASNANTSQAINQVAGEVQRVGAHAAAMAALKPIQYDPLEPTQVMAGVGNYRGETAAALGLAHYTNENTMFNVGVSVGGNHNMVNAGVTHKFGYSPEKKNIPDRYKAGPISSVYVMQDEVSSLKKENAEQKYVIADQAARLTTLEAENEQQRRELEETKKGLDDLKAAVDKLLASKG